MNINNYNCKNVQNMGFLGFSEIMENLQMEILLILAYF